MKDGFKGKHDSLIDKLFSGGVNTREFKKSTGRTIRIGGFRDYSKYSGRQLRAIRRKQAAEALKDQTHYADGTPIILDRVVDLWHN